MSIRPELEDALVQFVMQCQVTAVDSLGTVLVLTRKAKVQGLPLELDQSHTAGGGQGFGSSGSNINKITASHETDPSPGRGTPMLATEYRAFIDALTGLNTSDLASIEMWWVDRLVECFNSEPLRLNYDASKTLASVVRDLLDQALQHQKNFPDKIFVGLVLKHLVGATLELALPDIVIGHNGASVADTVSARAGDFVIDNAILHCTTAPSEALIRKCHANLQAGQHPIILTIGNKLVAAEVLAEQIGIEGRIEIMDAVQFLAANLYEMSLFKAAERKITVVKLIEKYNEIIAKHEADASLRIAFD